MHTHMYASLSISNPVEIFFKKLTDIIMEASKSKIYEVGRQAGDPGKSGYFSLSPEAICRQNSSLGAVSLFPLKAFTDLYLETNCSGLL